MEGGAGSGERLSDSSRQRISHACEICRAKRVRCTGGRPACSRCLQLNLPCSYGFARGGRRKRFLAALDEQAERSEPSALSVEDEEPEAEEDEVEGEGDEETPDEDEVMQDATQTVEINVSEPPDVASVPSSEAMSFTQVSPTTDQGFTATSTASISPSGRQSTAKSHRKTRISNACLECKRKRRKCSGQQPCELCVALNNDCIYDPSQDRRSKAYFHQKVIDGVLGAMSSNNPEEVLALLRYHAQFDDVASGIQSALNIAGHSGSSPSTISRRTESSTPLRTSQNVGANVLVICESSCVLPASGEFTIPWCPDDLQEHQSMLLNGPDYRTPPLNIYDDSPLSRAFTDFKDGARAMVENGAQLSDLLGPLDPNVELLFRERTRDDPFTASSWACEIGRVFVTIDFYTQLANIFLLTRYMRWVLDPTFENYTMLPALMRPTKAQRTIPHYPSADLYSIPEIRDCLVRGRTRLPEPVGDPNARGVKLKWPYNLDKAVIVNPVTGSLTISRLFSEFASDSRNWCSNTDFIESFPETKGYLSVVEHLHGWEDF